MAKLLFIDIFKTNPAITRLELASQQQTENIILFLNTGGRSVRSQSTGV